MNIWFTSDQHFGHDKIIKGQSSWGYRDFASIKDHDDYLLSKHNIADKRDMIVSLGDFGSNPEKYKNKIRCKNWIYIRGNHDPSLGKLKTIFGQNVYDLRCQRLKHHNFILCHYPILSWQKMRHRAFMLYGHCHATLKFDLSRGMDVGVDTNNYSMYHIDEIIARLDSKPVLIIDGHIPNE